MGGGGGIRKTLVSVGGRCGHWQWEYVGNRWRREWERFWLGMEMKAMEGC